MRLSGKKTFGLSAISWICVAILGAQTALADLDKARATAMWNRLLTQESTLGRLSSAPQYWDNGVLGHGNLSQQPSRYLHFATGGLYGGSAKIREDFEAEIKISSSKVAWTKAQILESAKNADDLQAKLDDFDSQLNDSDAHLKNASRLWASYIGGNFDTGESVKTGLTVVAVGAGVAVVAAGTVASGGALLAVAGGGTAASGVVITPIVATTVIAATVHGMAFSGPISDAAAKLKDKVVNLVENKTPPATGGADAQGGPTEITIEPLPDTPPPPAPVTVTPNDQGSWAAPGDQPKPPVTPPTPKPLPPKPKPKPKPPAPKPVVAVIPPVTLPLKPVALAPVKAPATAGSLFGAPGPHVATSVGGVGAADKANEIKCDDISKKSYTEGARLPRQILNYPDIIKAQQQLYFCHVNDFYSDDPQAIFLSRLGLRISAVGQVFKNPFTACGLGSGFEKVIKEELKDTLKDFKALETVDGSPELKKLEKDIVDLAPHLSCTELLSMITSPDNPPWLNQLNTDLCTWKKIAGDADQGGRTGSTLGFSSILAQCRPI